VIEHVVFTPTKEEPPRRRVRPLPTAYCSAGMEQAADVRYRNARLSSPDRWYLGSPVAW